MLIDMASPTELDDFERRLRALSNNSSVKVDWSRGGGVRVNVHKGLLKFDMSTKALRGMLTLMETGRRVNGAGTDDQ